MMAADPRIKKLAHLLVNYSTEVKKDERVMINGTVAAEPLLRELYREVLEAGAHPIVRIVFEDQEYVFYKHAAEHQIDFLDPGAMHDIESIDVALRTFPDMNPHALTGVDPELKQRRQRVITPVMELFTKRWGEGSLRWVGTACPTPALAQEAHMSFEEYQDFVYSCGALDEDDPIAYWKAFSRRQDAIVERLNQVKVLRYKGQDTDITFGVEGRPWINCDGKINFPDGEVFTSPIEDQVNGQIRFTFPAIFQGSEIEDILLRFEKGRVVEARAEKGQDLLHAVLDTDEGSRTLGEVAIGTNSNIQRFTKNMLFDEKIGGTVHCAVGRGFPMTHSKNSSAIHWDMLKDMKDGGEIFADDKLIYKDGKFLD